MKKWYNFDEVGNWIYIYMEEESKIEKLLKENLRLQKQILVHVEKTSKYILWIKILNIVKVAIILIPLVLAAIFLPPVVGQIYDSYKDVYSEISKVRQGEVDKVNPDVLKTLLP